MLRSDLKVDLVQSWGSDTLTVRAARTSTNTDQVEVTAVQGLANYLLQADPRHNSPLEHSGATFRLEVPMFVRDQIVRHRTLSYSIQSLRFGDAQPGYYLPPEHRPLHNAGSGARPNLTDTNNERLYPYLRQIFTDEARASWDAYRTLMELGVAGEVARGVLGANTYTTMYMTGNLWNWLQFLHKRIETEHGKPQWEIEQVALQVREHIADLFPAALSAFEGRAA